MAQVPLKDCDICEKSAGKHYCVDCEQLFCQGCKTLHLKTKSCNDHVFQDYDKINTEVKKVKCEEHGQQVVYFCDSCSVLLCNVCLPNTHKKHEFSLIDDAAAREKEAVEKDIQVESNHVTILGDTFTKVSKQIDEFKTSNTKTVQNITKHGDDIKKMVDKITKSYIDEVKRDETVQLEQKNKELLKIKEVIRQCEFVTKTARSALKDKNKTAFLAAVPEIKSSFEAMQKPDLKILEKDTSKFALKCFRQNSSQDENETNLRSILGCIENERHTGDTSSYNTKSSRTYPANLYGVYKTEGIPQYQAYSAGCTTLEVSLKKAIVRHSYDACAEDELTLKVDEIVNVISKDPEDSGWSKGELNGKVGMFPDNFVEIMQSDEFIYQEFYKTTSAAQQGTLFQLRNVIHRVDVSGPDRVVDSFRAHFSFVEDCLDAYIVGAAMNILGLDSLAGTPTRHQLHFLHFQTTEEKYAVIKELAKEIVQKHIHLDVDLEEKTAEAQELDDKMAQINAMFDSESKVYECTCGKKYKTLGFFKNHLINKHNWIFTAPSEPQSDSSKTSKYDHVAIWKAAFMKTALILRDTYDAYRMGDATRIFLNAKYELLCASVSRHTKYKIWLWRMLAYESALLSPRQAMEYKWNCSANLQGGIGSNSE